MLRRPRPFGILDRRRRTSGRANSKGFQKCKSRNGIFVVDNNEVVFKKYVFHVCTSKKMKMFRYKHITFRPKLRASSVLFTKHIERKNKYDAYGL